MSDPIDVNLDQLQRQINEAENYLQGFQSTASSGIVRGSNSSTGLRSSLRSTNTTQAAMSNSRQSNSSETTTSVELNTKQSISASSKYSDPKERQSLIDRLLADHAQRSRQNLSSDDAVKAPSVSFADTGTGTDVDAEPVLHFQHSAPNLPYHDPAPFLTGEGKEELSSVDHYHSGVVSHLRSSTPSGNKFTPSARYAAWELGDRIEESDEVRADDEVTQRRTLSADSADDEDHTLFFASDLAPSSDAARETDPFMETTYFGRLPSPPADSAAVRRAATPDESLMETVRVTKPLNPNVKGFSLLSMEENAMNDYSRSTTALYHSSISDQQSSRKNMIRHSANARIEGNVTMTSDDELHTNDSILTPTYVADSKYDLIYSSPHEMAKARHESKNINDQQQRNRLSHTDLQQSKVIHTEKKPTQQKKQQKSSAPAVAVKTTAAMRARLKFNQEKHLKKSDTRRTERKARGSSREKITSTGAIYGFGRSESPPKIRISNKDSTQNTRNNDPASPSKHYLKTRSEVEHEVDAEFEDQHPFQPTIYTKESSPGMPQTPDSLNHDDIGVKQRKTRLAPRGVARYMQPRRTGQSEDLIQKQQSKFPVDPFAQAARMKELHSSHSHRAMERNRQKEIMQQLELEECTFHPKIAKGSERILSQKEGLKQIDVDIKHFVNTGKWYDETKERSRSRARSESPAPRKPLAVSDQLYQDAQIRAAQQNWVREQVERARDAQYPFQPVINPSTDAIVHTQEKEYRPIHERIADIQREKKEYMARLKQSLEEEQSKLSSFQPTLTQRSRDLAIKRRTVGMSRSPSLNNRNRRSASVERLSGEEEAKQVLGFHTDVGSRLLDAGRVLARKKQMLANKYDDEVAETMEQAAISTGSRKILREKGLEKRRFEERQRDFQHKQKMNLLTKQHEEEERMQQFFKPGIVRKSSNIISNQHPERALETTEMRVKRLSTDDYEALQQRRKQRVAELYGSITFTPNIDPISKALGRSATVTELADPSYHQQARQRVQKEIDQREAKEYTYQPKINALSKKLMEYTDDNAFIKQYHREFGAIGWSDCPVVQMEQGASDTDDKLFQRHHLRRVNMKEPERMSRDIKVHMIEKEEKRRQELMAREIQELSDCTFQPRIDESMSGYERMKRDTSPVVVRGLGRHMELRYLTEKKKQDKKQREQEVFTVPNVDQYRRAADGSTIVQSFSFGSAADRSMNTSRITVSNGCPELQMDYLTLPTSHRMKNASDESAAAWVM